MPVTLNDLLEQGQKDGLEFSDDAAKEAAINALKKYAKPIYEAINNLAFGAGQAKMTDEVTAAKAAQQTAEARATKAETDLRTALDKAPEVATVNKQWEDKLTEARETHRKEVEQLTGRIRGSLLQRDQSALVTELHEKHNVPLAMAKVLAKDPDLLSRMDYDPNGTLSVRQAGQQIPLSPASGETHLGLLAEEIAGTVDKDLLVVEGDTGSGVNGGSRPGTGDAAFYKGIAEKAQEDQKGQTVRKPLRERIASRA
jgi:hypothetical protein